MARRLRCGRLVGFVPVLLMSSVLAAAPPSFDIKNLTLEELMEIDVYSASRRLEPVQGIPGAVCVLTGEDIRRSRAQSISEVLRLVPGVNVARVDASRWAISIRGFNERITHDIQVLIDGRSIYDPLFADTFCEMRETASVQKLSAVFSRK